MTLREAYDSLYSQIDMKNNPWGYRPDYLEWRQSQWMKPLASFIKEGRILDVGGGYGGLTKFLSDSTSYDDYVNLDLSTVLLKQSPFRNICGTAEKLPFPNETFDYVVLAFTFVCVPNKESALLEFHRILKTDGLLLMAEPLTGWYSQFKRTPFLFFIALNKIWVMFHSAMRPRRKTVEYSAINPKELNIAEKWLLKAVQTKGFKLIASNRRDNHVPWAHNGEHKLWRWFSDHFVPASKFGHCLCIIAQKKPRAQP